MVSLQNKATAISIKETGKHYPEIKEWAIRTVKIYNMSYKPELATQTMCSNVWFYEICTVPKDLTKLQALENAGNDGDLFQVVLLDGTLIIPNKKTY
jgi:hypothetical protein